MRKKAQIETIGLVVIIILLVTLGFIFISFIKPQKQQPLDTSTTLLTQAIVKTQTPYGEMKSLISQSYESRNNQNLRTELNKILQNFPKHTYSVIIQANNIEFLQINTCEGIVSSKIFTKNKIKYVFKLIQCETL